MNKISKKRIQIFGTVFLLFVPLFVGAAGLIPCEGTRADPCDFNDVMTLINNIINFIILITAPVGTIMFTYAGFLYLTAGGNSGQISKAHSVFWAVFIGFVIVLAAWIIVKSVSVLVTNDFTRLGP